MLYIARLIGVLCLCWTFFMSAVIAQTPVWQSDMDRVASLSQSLNLQSAVRARQLASAPSAPAEPLDPNDPFVLEVQDFTLKALQLSRTIRAQGGPDDLACIYKGMADDARSRLDAFRDAQTQADYARLYQAYADLFEVAFEISANQSAPSATQYSRCPG